MRYRILLLALAAACGGKPSTTPSPASDRQVRLLEADDVALPEVLFSAAKHLFNPDSSTVKSIGFGGVYVKKRQVPALSNDIGNYVRRIGGAQPTSRPGECETEAVGRSTPPRAPTVPASQTGGAPNPPSQPKRTTSNGQCNRGNLFSQAINFTGVRIASDTAYVELEVIGVATSTKCLILTVDKEAGGWLPGDTKPSKIAQCVK
jgi:hypothetical protein